MLLNYAGTRVTAEELVSQVYLPARKGSLQIEIVASTRRYQHIPYVIPAQFESLLLEIAAGNPVLILQNLGFSWAPLWHYAVVIGYHLPLQRIILHSAAEAEKRMPIKTFLRTWQRADNWGLVITATDKIPASAVEKSYLQAITDLKNSNNNKITHRAYVAAALRWPKGLLSLISLGNSFYNRGELIMAEKNYRLATHFHPLSGLALNNLAQTLFDLHKNNAAQEIALRAVAIDGVFITQARKTLQQIKNRLKHP